jgi:small GTP-binding protein
MNTAIKLAVVGHTNVGKTSLMRTLLRDAGFGTVSRQPSTTRHVEGARMQVDGEAVLELFDTPGLEEPIALLERLESYATSERLDAASRVDRFLADGPAVARFEQEAKVLRQLRQCDAGLLVIDVRDRVLAKHRDELQLLAACAVPLLPVFNFVRAEHSQEPAWREVLARSGLHAVVRFDSVAPERDAEPQLYAALGTVVERARGGLQRLLAAREAERAGRREGACALLADCLVEVAATRRLVPVGVAAEAAVLQLGQDVRALEQGVVEALLRLYQFDPTAVDAADLPVQDGRWEHDLFSVEALRDAGIRMGGGAAAGAAAGLGVDLAVGGISLGAAALIGAVAGGGLQGLRRFGQRAAAAFRGGRELSVDEPVLRLLALRLLDLVQALESRGHAAQAPVPLPAEVQGVWSKRALPGPLRRARAHPEWSSLSGRKIDRDARDAVAAALAAELIEQLDASQID